MCDCQCDFTDKYAPLGTNNSWIFDASEARYVVAFNNATLFRQFDATSESFFNLGRPYSGGSTRDGNQPTLPMRTGIAASGTGFTESGLLDPNFYRWGNSPLRNRKYNFLHQWFFTGGGTGVTSGTIRFKPFASPAVNGGVVEFTGVPYPASILDYIGSASAPYTPNQDIPCNNEIVYLGDYRAPIIASQDGTISRVIVPAGTLGGGVYPIDRISYVDSSVVVSNGRIFLVEDDEMEVTPVATGFGHALAHSESHVFGAGSSFALSDPSTVLAIPAGTCIGFGGDRFVVDTGTDTNNRSEYKIYDAVDMTLMSTFYARAIFTVEDDYIIGVDITTNSAKSNQNDLVMVVDFDDVETNLLQVIATTTFTQSNSYRELAWANGCLYGRGAWSISYP